jgi:hypothetical protein
MPLAHPPVPDRAHQPDTKPHEHAVVSRESRLAVLLQSWAKQGQAAPASILILRDLFESRRSEGFES